MRDESNTVYVGPESDSGLKVHQHFKMMILQRKRKTDPAPNKTGKCPNKDVSFLITKL